MKDDKIIDASLYNITIRKGSFDGEVFFEGVVKELPDIAEYADTGEEAYSKFNRASCSASPSKKGNILQ